MVAAWPDLPPAVRAGIVAMVKAATAYLLEGLERVDLSGLLADLEAAPRPVTPDGRPQSPRAGVP